MKLSMREEFNAPVEVVFAAITDIQAAAKWMPNLVSIELLTDGPYDVGTKWRETRSMFGREASEVFEVKALTPGKSIELYVDGKLGSSKRGEYRFIYDLEKQNGTTIMYVRGTMTGMGVMGALFGWLFKGMFRKAISKDHAALRDFVEASSSQAAPNPPPH